ncbi:hypothetical protein PVAP13_6NG029701 [Panicum virgatum]|uniref:Uncharacterized protein n=1 Tax=Panicum virgatum TaxID=38727 RepID=A0A8T0QS67_PANVG|nr:hypothetical protein PVAP13_6NG029701 [Panicum virgatum]
MDVTPLSRPVPSPTVRSAPFHHPVMQHQAVEPPSPWVSAPLVIPEILVGTPLARTFTMLAESNRRLQRMLYQHARWMVRHRAWQQELERVRRARAHQRIQEILYPRLQPQMPG